MTYTPILKSSTGKQIVGGILGMGVAGLLYLGIGQVSDQNLKGLLVSTNTVPDSVGTVSVNDTSTNDATLRRLAARAQTVAATLEQSNASVASAQLTTPINDRAAERGTQRFFASSSASALANAPIYDVNPNHVMTEKERLAIRAARVSYDPDPAVMRPFYGTLTSSPSAQMATTSVQDTAAVDPPFSVVMDPLHNGASEETRATNLPSSGFGLHFLLITSFLLVGFHYRMLLRTRVIAAWNRAQ